MQPAQRTMLDVLRVLIAARRVGSSGINTYTDHLASGLADHGGFDVVLLDETATEPSSGIMPLAPPKSRRLGPLDEWFLRGDVLRIARELDAHLVHVTQMNLAPRFQRMIATAWDPIINPIARYRAATMRGERPRREAAYGVIDAVACRRAAGILAITPMVARAARVFHRHVACIPPFLPDSTIRPGKAERSATVAMIANGVDAPRKGLRLALDAVAVARETRPDLRLTIYGSWIAAQSASGLPGFCDVRGYVDRKTLQAELPDHGCVIVPSLWEEFSYASLEALAAGVPVVSSPALGLLGVTTNGVLVARTREPTAVAARLLDAIAMEKVRFPPECLASTAIPAIERFYLNASPAAPQ